MIGRLVHKADFERLLATRARLRSAHFALHHLATDDPRLQRTTPEPPAAELSTEPVTTRAVLVDNSDALLWIGMVVPKRHARRAVTRCLIKRQARCAFERHAGTLAAGHWLLRLRAGFPAAQFVSARSPLLASAARSELESLLLRAHSR